MWFAAWRSGGFRSPYFQFSTEPAILSNCCLLFYFSVCIFCFGSKSTIHSIPNLSLNIPKYDPQGLSSIGISICPPCESPLNSLSASSLLSALIEILLLVSFRLCVPNAAGVSDYVCSKFHLSNALSCP